MPAEQEARVQVFLSWSGPRSKAMAQALRDWLPMVVQAVKPWMSDRDIGAGERWANEIGQHLDACNFGVLCLTPENLAAPWLHFEAGALSKKIEAGAVVPYLLGLDPADVRPPLGLFQAKRADKQHTLELVQTISARTATPLEAGTVAAVFDALWPKLEAALGGISAPAKVAEAPPRDQGDMIKELVTAVRDVNAKVDDLASMVKFLMAHSSRSEDMGADTGEGFMIQRGTEVKHERFGLGTVMSVDSGTDPIATVKFSGWGPKRVKVSFLRPIE